MSNNGGIAGELLRSFIERIERLEEEKKAIADDIRELYSEAKGSGFDAKVLRQVVRLRKMDKAERAEQEAILDLYMHALGMVPDVEKAADDFAESMARAGGGSVTVGDVVIEYPGLG